jgi:hypothetical protein
LKEFEAMLEEVRAEVLAFYLFVLVRAGSW